MPRDLVLDFRQGGGSVPEVPFGIVRIWGTEVRPNGPSVVVTTETTLKLTGGKATLANAQTSGTGPLYEWAYIIQVEPFCGRNYRFYVAIPDGTGPINLVDLPKLNPITGEGFYLDIEEWEALYADLPNRVDALETSQVVHDGKITSLEARPSGNATMRVDTSVGTRVFITDGVTEKLVDGDTGKRNVSSLLVNGWTAGGMQIQRIGKTVRLSFNVLQALNATAETVMNIPAGFRPPRYDSLLMPGFLSTTPTIYLAYVTSDAAAVFRFPTLPSPGITLASGVYHTVSWHTEEAWPSSLPGTPA